MENNEQNIETIEPDFAQKAICVANIILLVFSASVIFSLTYIGIKSFFNKEKN